MRRLSRWGMFERFVYVKTQRQRRYAPLNGRRRKFLRKNQHNCSCSCALIKQATIRGDMT
eukprot:scaffold1620_cov124-Skeletonema_menzelii.AAC.9